jgi:predicted ATPase/DNA-binding CsgD family transcriptional regulator
MAKRGVQLGSGAAGAAGLPADATVLVGRDAELERVCLLLSSHGVRLVTLTGPGGVGKTRLGLRAVALSDEQFADGVAFVSLGTLDDPLLVIDAIASVLGLAEAGARAPFDRVVSHLSERQMLLLLDGFEQLLDAAPVVSELLAACPQLKLLVTSRATLSVGGEHEFRVPPLALPPETADSTDLQALLGFPAATLFLQRAQAVEPALDLTPERARAVAEICRRVDGLPLAIELAAARVRLLSPEAMLERLGRRLELLTGGRRDAPPRQQTMRETIAWSYGLLAPAEQRLFRLLSVFAGGFTLEAAESVASDLDDGREGVLGLIESLLAQSMLVTLRDARIGMLETVQEYAAQALDAEGERACAEQAHASWCLELARNAESGLWGPEQPVWMERVERELPNLRAALRRLLDSGRSDEARELAAALERFWLGRGHLAEGHKWLEESLDTDHGTPGDRARAFAVAATLAVYGGETTQARTLADRALEVARAGCEQAAVAQALGAVALADRYSGDFADARKRFEEAIAILRELDQPNRLAQTLTRYAAVSLWSGDHTADAATFSAEALELCRAAGDIQGTIYASAVLACALITVDKQRCRALIRESLASSRPVGVQRETARLLFVGGMVSLHRGEHDRGLAELYEAAAIMREHGDHLWLALFCLPELARAHLLAGYPADAARLLEACDRSCATAGMQMPPWMRADEGGALDATRKALASRRYERARADGAKLTVEEALDTARRVADTEEDEELRALTSRELEVLRLLTRDMTDAQIAEELVLSRRTVHAHLRSIYGKLDVGSRLAAARWAYDHGLGPATAA